MNGGGGPQSILYLNDSHLVAAGLYDWAKALEDVERAFLILGKSSALVPSKPRLRIPQSLAWTVYMGYLGDDLHRVGLKWLTRVKSASNIGGILEGLVLLSDGESGRLQAVIQAGALTAVRTAATSSLACTCLRPFDAQVLTVLGAGVQADYHIRVMMSLFPTFQSVLLWNRSLERRDALLAKFRDLRGIIRPVDDLESAVRQGDVVVCAISPERPVVRGEWIRRDALVIDISSEGSCEPEVVVNADRVFIDWVGNDLANAYRGPGTQLDARVILGRKLDGDLVELVMKGGPWRSERERIFFASEGLVIEDLALASRLYESAVRLGVGQWLTLA